MKFQLFRVRLYLYCSHFKNKKRIGRIAKWQR
nr:MAG TPA: hypothetical protein [Caudoviricetes sp.]